MNKNFGLANFGKSLGKSTSPNAAKVIKTFYKQARNQGLLGQGKFLGMGTVRQTFHVRHKIESPCWKINWCFSYKILLKLHFK